MAKYIFTEFSKLGIEITPQVAQQMEAIVERFEVRGSHVSALNSQLLGVNPIAFKDEDRAAFFDLFGLREDALKRLVKSIPTIDNSYIVISDPFNLLAIWVVHLSYSLLKNRQQQQAFAQNVIKYLHYRFFTSIVNNMFPYGADERTMKATMNSLTRKFEIIQYGTWRLVIEARAIDVLSDGSTHRNAIRDGQPDDKFLYVITDIQTRLRDRVKNVVAQYYVTRQTGAKVFSKSSVIEIDGEQVLVDDVGVLDGMLTNVFAEVSNVRTFVEAPMVGQVARQFSAINASVLTQILHRTSALVKEQALQKQLDVPVITRRDNTKTVGIRLLVRDIIQSTFRYCAKHRIPLDNKALVYVRMKNVYSSSRIADDAINSVKFRTGMLIDDLADTGREATKSSLRLAFICYVILKTLKYA